VVELAHATPLETIEHALYPVENRRKTALLHHLLGGPDFSSAIVFLRTKRRARRLAEDLDAAGHRAVALQGNMSQNQRQRAMQGFREGRYDVLVATDIAARGIDVAEVSHVINYDVPNTPDAYTHRIGRTGRAECRGKACTFVTEEDRAAIAAIERQLRFRIPRVELRSFAAPGGPRAAPGNPGERSRSPRADEPGRGRARTRRGPGEPAPARSRGRSRGRAAGASATPARQRDGRTRGRRRGRVRSGQRTGRSR
jgi:ATP-dependent RNA helicase RhlE